MKKFYPIYPSKSSGFTIMEAVLAIFVLTIGVIGAYSVISQTIFASSLNQSRLTAYYLAQEGIEIVRNIRDGNWLQGESWNNGLGVGDYEADYTSQALITSYMGMGNPLNIDTNKFYSYSSPATMPPCNSYGDVSGDGLILSEDANLIMQFRTGQISLTEEQKKRADVSGNGGVELNDAMLIGQYLSWRQELPVCPGVAKKFAITPFKRKITISQIEEGKTLEVTVSVSWQERGRTHSAQTAEKLYNWYGTQ